jgi:hypothetical protein
LNAKQQIHQIVVADLVAGKTLTKKFKYTINSMYDNFSCGGVKKKVHKVTGDK